MAMPIAPTPFLTGRDAERFDRIVADGLAHNTLHKPRSVDMQWLDRAIANIETRNVRERIHAGRRLQVGNENRNCYDFSGFFGKVKFPEDGVAFQRRLRDEW